MTSQETSSPSSAAASPSPAAVQAAVKAVYEYAAHMMKAGVSDWQISKALVEKGLTPEQAQIVIRKLHEARAEVFRKAGVREMLIGGGICLLGLFVTLGTYGAASSSPSGGSYVVAWGAIIFGAVQFFRGLSRYSSKG